MIHDELAITIEKLAGPGKGILAADESNPTIEKRFKTVNVASTSGSRKSYRQLLFTTPELAEAISGVILFEETLRQKSSDGEPFPAMLRRLGMLPGIKVDKGLSKLPNSPQEKITMGLDGLRERLTEFKSLGACFAKWRNVYTIADALPTLAAIKSGAENLARYAAECQALGIVPVVEPEVLMDGNHDITQCAEITEIVLHELFNAMFIHQVTLENILLKPSMVIEGSGCEERSSAEQVAEFTLSVFRNNVPASIPSIHFLSGGQSDLKATEHLNAMNLFDQQPWNLSFSFGRALQSQALSLWAGKEGKYADAQAALLHRAKMNAAASLGEYDPSMED